jgi:hypothetical protein
MEQCKWEQEIEDGSRWSTSCGHSFYLSEGMPGENEMAFCCFCGKEIIEVPCPLYEDLDYDLKEYD